MPFRSCLKVNTKSPANQKTPARMGGFCSYYTEQGPTISIFGLCSTARGAPGPGSPGYVLLVSSLRMSNLQDPDISSMTRTTPTERTLQDVCRSMPSRGNHDKVPDRLRTSTSPCPTQAKRASPAPKTHAILFNPRTARGYLASPTGPSKLKPTGTRCGALFRLYVPLPFDELSRTPAM